MSGFADELVAGETLVRSAIQSPGYVPGSAGWRIAKDGTVDLNDATVRGGLHVGAGTGFIDATDAIPAELASYYLTNDGIALISASIRYHVTVAGRPYYAYSVMGALTLLGQDTVISAFGLVDSTLKVIEVWRAEHFPGGGIGMTVGRYDPVGVAFQGGIDVVTESGDWQVNGVSAPRGLISRNTATANSANFGTGPFTVISCVAPAGGWPAGRAYEVRYDERLKAVTGTPRVATWISGGTVTTSVLYQGGFTPPIQDTADMYEHPGTMRFIVNTAMTSNVFLRHNCDAGTALSATLITPALRWLEVWDIGSSADFPDLKEMV